jgi:hypothetical protein
LRFREARVTFVEFDEVGDPESRGIGEHFVDACEVQIAPAAFRKADVAHGPEGNANEQMEALAIRFDEGLNGDIVGNVVSGRAVRQEEKKSG